MSNETVSSPPPATSPAEAVVSTGRFEVPHLLMADPEAAFLKLVELAFKRRGHQVTAVSSPRQAQEILDREPIDLLICELHFPDGGGYALLEHIRATPALRRLPVIVLSKDRKARSKVRALEIGADDVLHKPCLLDELFVRVENMVEKRRELFRAAHDVRGELAGKLRSLPVQELFPLLHQGRKSGLLRLGETGIEMARVWWKEGEVVHATFGPLNGEEAVYALFPLRAGNFEFRGDQVFQGAPNVDATVTSLLLEGLRRLDETVTFQLIGGRPKPGPRGAHIEWFADEVRRLEFSGASQILPAVRKPPRPEDVRDLREAFEAFFAQPAARGTIHFADLHELKDLFRLNGQTWSHLSVVLACELEEGLRLLEILAGVASPQEIQRALRSGVELFPTAQFRLGQGHILRVLAAPLSEMKVISRSVPQADAFYVAPPGGRWLAPELRDEFKSLLRRSLPLVCLPVGDGTVVEGLSALLNEANVPASVCRVVEHGAGDRTALLEDFRRMLAELGQPGKA